MKLLFNIAIALALTLLTQLGGMAWVFAALVARRLFGHRARLAIVCLLFIVTYGAAWAAAQVLAPNWGRVAIPCANVPTTQIRTPLLYCALLRNFVAPDVRDHGDALAQAVDDAFPGSVTLALDGGFPFWDAFPMLPHLSHANGRRLDLAFFYADPSGRYRPGHLRSPIGYGAFERPGPGASTPCAGRADRLTLRWDWTWLQPAVSDAVLEPERTGFALRWLARTRPKDGRVRLFIEPHLAERFQASGPAIGFQGCRAARHDDHVHMHLIR